jgi:hypothetical protein
MVRSVKGISGDRSEPVMYAMIYDYGMAPDIAVERLILQIARKFFFVIVTLSTLAIANLPHPTSLCFTAGISASTRFHRPLVNGPKNHRQSSLFELTPPDLGMGDETGGGDPGVGGCSALTDDAPAPADVRPRRGRPVGPSCHARRTAYGS